MFHNGSVVAFVIFFVVLVLCSCGCVSFLICFVVCVCVPVVSLNVFLCFVVYAFLCVFVWWIVVALFGPIYDVYIICGFDFGLVGWPSPAVCAPLI